MMLYWINNRIFDRSDDPKKRFLFRFWSIYSPLLEIKKLFNKEERMIKIKEQQVNRVFFIITRCPDR